MLDRTLTTSEMATGRCTGKTIQFTRVNGRKEYNMEKGS